MMSSTPKSTRSRSEPLVVEWIDPKKLKGLRETCMFLESVGTEAIGVLGLDSWVRRLNDGNKPASSLPGTC